MQDRSMYGANQPGGRQGSRRRQWQGEGGDVAGGVFGAPGKGERRHGGGAGRGGGGREGGGRDGGGRGGRRGGGMDRARRGDARYILLDALRDSPKHGYEIIKGLEERSAGRYVPSPGTVYPTLQYLEDQGLVRATQEGERRIYQLTEAGQTELDAQAEQVVAFWKRFAGQGLAAATHHEVRFLQDELEHLNHIVWSGLRPDIAEGRQDAIRRVRSVIEECQNKIREIIAAEPTE